MPSQSDLYKTSMEIITSIKIYRNHPKTDLNVAEEQVCRIISLPSSPQLCEIE